MPRRIEPLSILILCTANSARSQLAEALFRHHGGNLVRVASAGSRPGPGPHRMAVSTLAEMGIDWTGKHSKGMDEVGTNWDLVITVCDNARDSCPVLPGHHSVHWGLTDPAGSTDERAAFAETAKILSKRISALLELPWDVMSDSQIAAAAKELA